MEIFDQRALARKYMEAKNGLKEYFKPTENVRVRDFVRELPKGIIDTAKNVAQDAVRFGISAVEAPNAIRTGQATGRFYNTPIGRVNSFQSEAQARVQRGDPLWKAIGNPAMDTILAGSDMGAVAKPFLTGVRSVARALPRSAVTREVGNIATDLMTPFNQKRMIPGVVDRLPARWGNANKPVFSENVKGLQAPNGLRLSGKVREIGPMNMDDVVEGRSFFKQDTQMPLPAQAIRRTPDRVEMIPFRPKSQFFRGAMRPGLTIEDVSRKPSSKKGNNKFLASDFLNKQINRFDNIDSLNEKYTGIRLKPNSWRASRERVIRKTIQNPLLSEARKYKTEEEFLKAQTIRDYVSEVKPTILKADDRSVFKTAGEARGNAREITNKEIEIAQRDNKIFEINKNKSIEQLQKEISESKKFADENNTSYPRSIQVKEGIIKIKSKLSAIYKQAHGKK